MTLFIKLRADSNGGFCAPEPSLWEGETDLLSNTEFSSRVHGRDVIVATHGFNVDQSHGVAALSYWSAFCNLSPSSLFVGVLWPGDSKFFPIIDYPEEGDVAITSGQNLAAFLNKFGAGANSYSFVSHSLGARVVLEALKGLDFKARRLILMAGAIEDDCLVNEYKQAADNAQEIYVIASESDWVLEVAFPIGNPVGEIIMRGHPYFKKALGRDGPVPGIASGQLGGAWQIPNPWDYGHLDYLPSAAAGPLVPPQTSAPGPNDPIPIAPALDGWKPVWSAGAVSTQVK